MWRIVSYLLWLSAAATYALLLWLLVGVGGTRIDFGPLQPTPTAGPSTIRYACWYSVDARRDVCDWIQVPRGGR